MNTRLESYKIPGKSELTDGTEFSVPFEGRFIFRWADIHEGTGFVSITGYGGKGKHQQWRSFRPEQVRVHRIDKTRSNTT
jgi:hypothetical protein